jgi:hypothetical protein
MNALSTNLKNDIGNSHTFEENKQLIYAIEAALNRRTESLNNKTVCPTEVSWQQIEEEVARDFRARCQHITDLRKVYFINGDVLVCGEYVSEDDDFENMQCGAANPKYQQKHQTLYGIHYLAISKFVDSKHSKGEGVTNRKIQNYLRKEHVIIVARTSISWAFRKLGLTWMKVKPNKRTLDAF